MNLTVFAAIVLMILCFILGSALFNFCLAFVEYRNGKHAGEAPVAAGRHIFKIIYPKAPVAADDNEVGSIHDNDDELREVVIHSPAPLNPPIPAPLNPPIHIIPYPGIFNRAFRKEKRVMKGQDLDPWQAYLAYRWGESEV